MLGSGFLAIAILAVLMLFLGALLLQWLWNTTIPEVFGLKTVRYWVAFRLLLIAALLSSGGFLKFHATL